jgi:hypothetical protein
LEFMKLVWRTFKKRTRVERETSCSSWIGSGPGAAALPPLPGDEVSSVINYLHPEVREVVEEAESWIAEETPNAAVNTSSVPCKEGLVLIRKAESAQGATWRRMFAKTMDGFLVLYETEHAQQPLDVRHCALLI